MSRYIDADRGLRSRIQRKTRCNFITADEIVSGMPTEDVVPLDRIKEAREEINKMGGEIETIAECLQILNKLIAESEG